MEDGGIVVDDHPVVIDGLRASLEPSPGFEVLGEAGSGEEALRRVDEVRPDVVLRISKCLASRGWRRSLTSPDDTPRLRSSS
ncbi:MAG: response regulator transcription factor [Nocardioides sp.]